MFSLLLASAALCASAMSIQPEAYANLNNLASSKPGFVQTFLDSFEGPSGSLVSRSDWIVHLGTSYPGGPAQWVNNEFQSYTDSIDNIRITSDKNLMITPRLRYGSWTSARIERRRGLELLLEESC